MATPCLITFSRSTFTNFCGTLGRNVVLIEPISGRLRAAARNLSKLAARNCTSFPARSSSTYVNPPEVPTPGIAGGAKLKTVPTGRLLSCWFRRALISWYCSALVFGWHAASKEQPGAAEGHQCHHGQYAFSNQHTGQTDIAMRGPLKDAIEPVKE